MHRQQQSAHAAILAISVLLLGASAVQGQGFVHRYGDLGPDERLGRLRSTPDGGCVFVGTRIDPGGNSSDAWIAKLDADGLPEWQVQVAQPDWATGVDVVQLADGTYVAGGNLVEAPVLVALDASGAQRWQVEIPRTAPGNGLLLTGLTPAADGTVLAVLIGFDDGGGPASYGVFVAGVDPTGALSWMRKLPFDVSSSGTGYVARLAAAPNGTFLVAGHESEVACLDAAGLVRWHVDLQTVFPHGVVALPDSSFALFSNRTVAGSGRPWIGRFLPDGTLAWQQELVGAISERLVDVTVTPGGEILLAGSTTLAPGAWAASLVTLDLAGMITSQRALDGVNASRVAALADGSILLGADWPDDVHVARIPAGGLPPACATELPTTLTVAPASDSIVPAIGATTDLGSTGIPVSHPLVPANVPVEVSCSAAGCVADAAEPDDACARVRGVLLPGASLSRNACDDAEDWFGFHACAGQPHVIETSSLGLSADTVLELWAPDCATLLLTDDDSGAEPRASRLDWVAPSSGTYRVRVLQSGGASGPDREYAVTLTRPSCEPPTWVRRFEGTAGAGSFEAVAEDASGLVLCGRTTSTNPPGRAWMADVTLAGDVVSRTEHAADRDGRLNDFLLLPDGTRVVVGRVGIGPPPNTTYLGWIAHLDATGTPLWSKSIDYPGGSVSFVAVDRMSDGSFVAAGLAGVGSDRSAVVACFETNGRIRWQRRLDEPTASMVSVFDDVAVLSDGTVACVGSSGSAFFSREALVVGFDAAGNVQWQAKPPKVSSYEYPRAVVALPDGRALAALTMDGLGTWLLALDPDGTIAWQRGLEMGAQSISDYGLRVAPGGGVFLIGSPVTFLSVGMLHRITANGELEWSRTVRSEASLRDVMPTSDGGIVLVGQAEESNVAIAGWMAKLDALGLAHGDCPDVVPFDAAWYQPSFQLVPSALLVADPRMTASNLAVAPVPGTTTIDERCNETGTCPAVAVTLVLPATSCVGVAASYSASADGRGPFTFEWDFDWDGVTFDVDAAGATATWTFTTAGSYTVACRVTDSCATPAPQQVVEPATLVASDPPLAPTIVGAAVRCSADPCTVLSAPAGFASYMWSTGDTASSTCVAPAFSASYTVTVTDAAGCSATSAAHSVTTVQSPQAFITLECRAGRPLLGAVPFRGLAPYSYSWSTGETTDAILVGAGTFDLEITDANGCTATAQHVVAGTECSDLREVSGPGAPPLRVTKAGLAERLRFEELPGVPAYDFHVGPFGDWLSRGTAAGRTCWRGTWTDEGDGTLSVTTGLPANSWVVVTASNQLGEGPAGSRSDGAERSLLPGWDPCGASP